MHDTAFEIGRLFFETYCGRETDLILEIGSQNVNGSLRECAPRGSTYIGVDLTRGDGVDIVLDDPYELPFADGLFDAAIASSCFEHDPMFWLTFLEVLRVTKVGGLVYLSTPSNGSYHGHPSDNWRFYPDAGLALTLWGKRQGREVTLLESFIARRKRETWNDCVIVFRRGAGAGPIASRIVDRLPDAYNVRRDADSGFENFSAATEDMRLLGWARDHIRVLEAEITRLRDEVARHKARSYLLVRSTLSGAFTR